VIYVDLRPLTIFIEESVNPQEKAYAELTALP